MHLLRLKLAGRPTGPRPVAFAVSKGANIKDEGMKAHPAEESRPGASDRSNFVIYCTRRTGSFHLSSLLDSAPDIVCHGELFRQWEIPLAPKYKQRLASFTKQQRDNRPLVFINRLRRMDPDLQFGFKLFSQHVERLERLQHILRNGRWKKIALLREPIEVYASLLRAQLTRRWARKASSQKEDESAYVPVHYSEETLKAFAVEYRAYLHSALRHAGDPDWLLVPYDRLNDLSTRQHILDFLGSGTRAQQLSSEFVKQYDRPLCEAFDNWQEIADYLERENPFEGLNWSDEPQRKYGAR
jgi:hypothetical protein